MVQLMEKFVLGNKMKTKINLIRKKPYGTFYDLFLDDKKINPKKEVELNKNSTLYLIERNIVLSRFWWLWFIIDFIMRIFGSDLSLDECNSEQKIIPIKLKGNIAEKIDIIITENSENILIVGQEDFEVGEVIKKDCPRIKKRIKWYKIIIVSAMITLLLIIAFIIFMTVKDRV